MANPVVIPTQIDERFAVGELVAAIAQDAQSKDVLMLGWMNKQALTQTLETGDVTYWSRSRNEFWQKGATSGHTQKLVSIAFDCDADAVLLQVHQVGAACHTGQRTCFHNEIDTDFE